ncbi:HAMP domain-containing histidine kinase [Mesorhizobium sp. CGMCC 1.15528]|uniref:histidine kinase n=1 Tax=Mesorhizobium zhangyense TaxID=1776730 RepID=A0A7C9VB64_9HYPH|nr:HAMP domain-containing sensor histidine kinase [Mesorhizobium zhangyense]NGN45124.1 HAMP domain-containing histidine kinase [Mesorhizobium zhangyense]
MRSSSLRWRFTVGFIVLQVCAVIASLGLVFYLLSGIKTDVAITSVWLSQEIADSIDLGPDGRARLEPTAELTEMMEDAPDLWFVADLGNGGVLSHGATPEDIASNTPFLKTFRSVELHGYLDDPLSVARMERFETPAGEATIFAGGAPMSQYGLTVLLGHLAVGVPALILIAISLIGVPFVTRWALRSFSNLKERLDRIDLDTRGALVEERGLPNEVLRLVRDINRALRRLDNGFEATERFFVNAAHELRTPIAVLQVRIDTLSPSEDKTHLQTAIKRLTAIANQLLDTEKYRQKPQQDAPVDLNGVVSKVVADLAPLAIAEGYEISFDSDAEDVFVPGDAEALERAFANLVRNAVQYGGGRGQISVGIEADGSVTVTDQGRGIAGDKQSRIFEPFYRVSPHGSGAGLGLSMVNEIVTRHGGYVELSSAPGKGSTFAVRWRDGRILHQP